MPFLHILSKLNVIRVLGFWLSESQLSFNISKTKKKIELDLYVSFYLHCFNYIIQRLPIFSTSIALRISLQLYQQIASP